MILPRMLSATGAFVAAALAVAQDQPAPRTALDVGAPGPKTFYADDRVGNNQVTFLSESTIEDFTGVCNRVGGECQLDPKHLEALQGRFFVRVEDLRTGIELRDQHLRSPDWMDAAKHPEIVIAVSGATDVKKDAPDGAALTLLGRCSLHGVSKEVRIPCTLKYLPQSPETQRRVKGDLIRLRANWTVKLSDYGVTGPKEADIIGLKVSNDIQVKVSIFGSTEKPPEALKPDTESKPAETPRPPPPRRP